MAGQRPLEPAGLDLPEPDLARGTETVGVDHTAAAGGEGLTVGTEGDTRDGGRVAQQRIATRLPIGNVPKPDTFVRAARREQLAVGTKRDSRHGAGVPSQR